MSLQCSEISASRKVKIVLVGRQAMDGSGRCVTRSRPFSTGMLRRRIVGEAAVFGAAKHMFGQSEIGADAVRECRAP